MPVIPALERLRQEDCHKFKASLGNAVGSWQPQATFETLSRKERERDRQRERERDFFVKEILR